jgi:WD40 repeat protein
MFWTFKGSSSALSVTFSSCRAMIASGNMDWTIQIWNILSRGCDCIFQGHSDAVTDVCWLGMWNLCLRWSYSSHMGCLEANMLEDICSIPQSGECSYILVRPVVGGFYQQHCEHIWFTVWWYYLCHQV